MTFSKLNYDQQRGSIMLAVVMIFLLVSFLGFAVIELGLMEYKSSCYDYQAVQAQQSVDAGVDWGLENIYAELVLPDNLIVPTLPVNLTCGSRTIWLNAGESLCEINIGDIVSRSVQTGLPGSCTYEYTVTAMYEGACRKATVQSVYYFNGGYQYIDSEGSLSFMPREYLNGGQISCYQTLK